jgi:hypothetical protein
VVNERAVALHPVLSIHALPLAAGGLLTLAAVLWCAQSSTRFFEAAMHMQGQRWLIAYPSFLIYACFALITIF